MPPFEAQFCVALACVASLTALTGEAMTAPAKIEWLKGGYWVYLLPYLRARTLRKHLPAHEGLRKQYAPQTRNWPIPHCNEAIRTTLMLRISCLAQTISLLRGLSRTNTQIRTNTLNSQLSSEHAVLNDPWARKRSHP